MELDVRVLGRREVAMNTIPPTPDLRNPESVREYFRQLEEQCPEVIEALRVLNVSYAQYLAALLAMNQQSSFTTSSTPPLA